MLRFPIQTGRRRTIVRSKENKYKDHYVTLTEKTFRLPRLVSLFMLLVATGSSYLSIQHIRITPQNYPNISVILYGHSHLRWMKSIKVWKPSEDLLWSAGPLNFVFAWTLGAYELLAYSHHAISNGTHYFPFWQITSYWLQSRVLCPDFLAESCVNLATERRVSLLLLD